MHVFPTQPFAQASLFPTGGGRSDPSIKIKSSPPLTFLFGPNVPQMHENISLHKSHTAGGAMLHLRHFPPRGTGDICGLAADPAPRPAQPAPKPSLEPALKPACLFHSPSIPEGHLKAPPSQAEPLPVLHLAHTPTPDTCAGREFTDLAGRGQAAGLWLSLSPLRRKHLVLPDGGSHHSAGEGEGRMF